MINLRLAILFAVLPVFGAPLPMSREDFIAGEKRLQEMKKVERRPVLERPLMFVRGQTKYSGRLYLPRYDFDDRPLFNDRRLWEPEGSDHKVISFRKTFELYQLSGLDGFATFAWPNAAEYKRTMMPVFQAGKETGLPIMLEVAPNLQNTPVETLKLIADSPCSFRVNGKSLVSSYIIDKHSPEKLSEQFARFNQHANGKLAFLPQIHFLSLKDRQGKSWNSHSLYDLYRRHGTLPASLLNTMENYLRSYLAVSEGLYIGHIASNYDGTFNDEFTTEVLVPIFKSVLAEPEYNGKKLLAIQGKTGYTSYYGAQTLSRDGTVTLRKLLKIFRESGADMYIGTEWDELNEDTGFEPLVGKPMSTQRILRYFSASLKGEKPTPLPGDDLNIPNLIVSYRQQIVPGTHMHIELLNVPDGTRSVFYTVALELYDESGERVWGPRSFQFNSVEEQEHTIKLPSEEFKDCRTLRPRLSIRGYDADMNFGDGLPFTILRTAVANQQYFCIPLRNVLRPEYQQIQFKPDGVEVDFRGKELLSTVEVLQDNLEIFAYDPHNEYLQNDSERVLFRLKKLSCNAPPRMLIDLDIKVENAPSLVIFERNPPAPTRLAREQEKFTSFRNARIDNWDSERQYFSLKKEDIGQAVFQISGKRKSGINSGKTFTWTLPLKELTVPGVASQVFEDGIAFTLESNSRPAEQPLPFTGGKVKFDRHIHFDNPNGVVAVRIVSQDGKIYWSAPYPVNQRLSGENVPFYGYSDAKHKYIRMDLPVNRIPEIKYDFDPKLGYILPSADNAREYYAMAGSYIGAATNFQGLEGNVSPVKRMFERAIPGADKGRPEWRRNNKDWALEFDGERGNFLIFGNTLIPQRAGFTLSFEIIPEDLSNNPQLFVNGVIIAGSLAVSVHDGHLHLSYIRRLPGEKTPYPLSKNFQTRIPLVTGRRQKVRIVYDGNTITASANGLRQSFPLEGIGLYNQYSNFGGLGTKRNPQGGTPYFKGQLLSFEVKHYPESLNNTKEIRN